jgi:hypothetical protein
MVHYKAPLIATASAFVGNFLFMGLPGILFMGPAIGLLQVIGLGHIAAKVSGDQAWPTMILSGLFGVILILPAHMCEKILPATFFLEAYWGCPFMHLGGGCAPEHDRHSNGLYAAQTLTTRLPISACPNNAFERTFSSAQTPALKIRIFLDPIALSS